MRTRWIIAGAVLVACGGAQPKPSAERPLVVFSGCEFDDEQRIIPVPDDYEPYDPAKDDSEDYGRITFREPAQINDTERRAVKRWVLETAQSGLAARIGDVERCARAARARAPDYHASIDIPMVYTGVSRRTLRSLTISGLGDAELEQCLERELATTDVPAPPVTVFALEMRCAFIIDRPAPRRVTVYPDRVPVDVGATFEAASIAGQQVVLITGRQQQVRSLLQAWDTVWAAAPSMVDVGVSTTNEGNVELGMCAWSPPDDGSFELEPDPPAVIHVRDDQAWLVSAEGSTQPLEPSTPLPGDDDSLLMGAADTVTVGDVLDVQLALRARGIETYLCSPRMLPAFPQ